MPSQFDGLGMSLMYPENWKIEEETDQSVTLESPGGAFLAIAKVTEEVAPADLLQQAKDAMLQEYEMIEEEIEPHQLASESFVAEVMRFVYLDLIIVAKLMVIPYPGGLYLTQIQGVEQEIDQLTPVFNAMLTSMCNSIDQPQP